MANLPCEHIAGGGGDADEQERQVDMQAEEVEEHVGVDLSVGVAGKINYEEPGSGSVADFVESGKRPTSS
jgi:hypothetical protein